MPPIKSYQPDSCTTSRCRKGAKTVSPYLQAESHTGPHEGNDIWILLESDIANNHVLLHLPQDAVDPSASESGFLVFRAAAQGRAGSTIPKLTDRPDFDLDGARVLDAEVVQYLALSIE